MVFIDIFMNKFIYFTIALLFLISCDKSSEPTVPETPPAVVPENVERTVVVYATNRSSLSYDFKDDKEEMLEAVANIDLQKFQLLLFYSDSATTSGLFSATYDESSDEYTFTKVKEYDRLKTTTDPEQIARVLDDALALYPNSKYDLVFWGHGMSWYPYFTDHEIITKGIMYSYGGEYDGGTNPNGMPSTNWTDLDDLASAVPDNKFDTIWFDCCYMSGIEVLYEFAGKCNTIVAYPTEVWQYGLPYDSILPFLLSEQHDLVGAAREFYNYYTLTSDPVTVAVCDMSGLEDVAELSRKIINSGELRPETKTLLNYSRSSVAPFYDLRQFMSETAELNGVGELVDDYRMALDRLVTFHAESPKNFNGRPWDTANICGISTHYYKDLPTKEEDYYRTLKWFKRVYTSE